MRWRKGNATVKTSEMFLVYAIDCVRLFEHGATYVVCSMFRYKLFHIDYVNLSELNILWSEFKIQCTTLFKLEKEKYWEKQERN